MALTTLLTESQLKKYYTQTTTAFFESYESSLADHSDILSISQNRDLKDGQASATLNFLAAMQGWEEWKGEFNVEYLKNKGLQIIPKKWSASLGFSVDDIKDGLFADYLDAIRQKGELARLNEVQQIINFFDGANAITCYDGGYFFGNGHADSQDNDLTSVAAAADAVPTVEELHDNVLAAMSAMKGFTNEQGQPMYFGGYNKKPLLLLVEHKLWGAANALVSADTVLTDVGTVNKPNQLFGKIRVVSSPLITTSSTTTRFYLIDDTRTVRPLIKVNKDMMKSTLTPDVSKDEIVWRAKERWNFAPGAWAAAVRHIFTT